MLEKDKEKGFLIDANTKTANPTKDTSVKMRTGYMYRDNIAGEKTQKRIDATIPPILADKL